MSKDEIIQKLKECNNDHILVIKSYFGIKHTPHKEVTSINQEIYKQLEVNYKYTKIYILLF